MSYRLQVLPISELSLSMFEGIGRLMALVWPEKVRADRSQEENDALYAKVMGRQGTSAVMLDENGAVVAHASIFRREILLPVGKMTVGALAGVCSHPELRGQGLGVQVVRATFETVERGEYPVSFFQTGVPGFYEKLGARLVFNRCFNSLNEQDPEGNPWWEPYLMVYPGAVSWPEGDIDLLGPGW